MDTKITLPPVAEGLSPCLITSPTRYGGTALLQRMICRSGNAICYGDNLFEELLSILEWSTSLIDAYQPRRQSADESLAVTLKRNPKKWMPDLAPEFDLHMSSIFSAIYNIPMTAQQYAHENGFDRWGIIRSAVPSSVMIDLLSIFPVGKAIFIHRSPFDAARDLLRDQPDADLTEFCDEWSGGMYDYLQKAHPSLTKLRYEDAVADPGPFLKNVEAATGIEDLSAETLDAGDESELAGTRELSATERDIIAARCEDMLTVYYPELVQDGTLIT